MKITKCSQCNQTVDDSSDERRFKPHDEIDGKIICRECQKHDCKDYVIWKTTTDLVCEECGKEWNYKKLGMPPYHAVFGFRDEKNQYIDCACDYCNAFDGNDIYGIIPLVVLS